jgi:uncharacterized protein YsxB (DUF464 family)
MTQITISRDRDQRYTGFCCIGHAGFAESGEDIVCAGISVLVINTINSLEQFTDDPFTVDSDEDAGRISVTFQEHAGHDAAILIDSMILGLSGIRDSYGKKYLILDFREV